MKTPEDDVLKILVIDAFRKLQRGSILQAVSHIFAIIGLTMLLITIITVLNTLNASSLLSKSSIDIDIEVLEKYLAYSLTMFVSLLITLLAFVLLVISVWGFIVPGAKALANIDARFTRASNLISLGWIWGIIVTIISFVTLAASAYLTIILPISLGLLIVGFILIVLGYAGIIILAIKLSDIEKIEKYETTAILFVLSSFIPLIIPIPWLHLYLALKTSEIKHLGLSS